jgi:hypothetical protein
MMITSPTNPRSLLAHGRWTRSVAGITARRGSLMLASAFLLLASLTAGEPERGIREALRLHASFDRGLEADFSRGDPVLYRFRNQAERVAGNVAASGEDEVSIVPDGGRYGGALRRSGASAVRLFYQGRGLIDGGAPSFSGTISLWLRVSPDEDLPPGYCDPVMIMAEDHRRGFIFLEWSADHSPRKFRYAILPTTHRWNPRNLEWEALPEDQRPMVQLNHRPFARDRWVHVVATFDQVNQGQAGSGKLYVDGKLQGSIAGWDLTFDWDPEKVIVVVGAGYVGDLDDLALFDRALNADEVRRLGRLKDSVGDLYRPEVSSAPR